MHHVPGVSEPNSIAAAECLNDRPGATVCFVTRPVALQFQQHLNPRGHLRSRSFHSAQRQRVTLRRNAAAGVGDDEDLVAFRQRREYGE